MIPNHYNMKTWLVFSCHMNSKTNVFQYKFDIHFKRLIGFPKKKSKVENCYFYQKGTGSINWLFCRNLTIKDSEKLFEQQSFKEYSAVSMQTKRKRLVNFKDILTRIWGLKNEIKIKQKYGQTCNVLTCLRISTASGHNTNYTIRRIRYTKVDRKLEWYRKSRKIKQTRNHGNP